MTIACYVELDYSGAKVLREISDVRVKNIAKIFDFRGFVWRELAISKMKNIFVPSGIKKYSLDKFAPARIRLLCWGFREGFGDDLEVKRVLVFKEGAK